MAITSFNRKVSASSVLNKECDGCWHLFNKKDIATGNKAYKTATGLLFCQACYGSEFNMEEWVLINKK